jgi:hypothetical protein
VGHLGDVVADMTDEDLNEVVHWADKMGAVGHPSREAAAVRELAARLAADRPDALRYRWLRDISVPPHNFYLSVPTEFDGVRYAPAEVDAYVDAAITSA